MAKGDIDVTNLDLRKLVEAAFTYSKAQGLGFLHDKPGDLTDEEYAAITNDGEGYGEIAASADYIRGRSMKLTIRKKDGRLFWYHRWYDHTRDQSIYVLIAAGMSAEAAEEAMQAAEAGAAMAE